jgi:RNA polymerase sigma-70 factor (ECF subfamily)
MVGAGTLTGSVVTSARAGGEACGDGCLLRELIGGSEAAFAALYDRYSASVYATARHTAHDLGVADEVVQETFLALWNRAEQFDPSRGSLIAWLRTIARNRAVDHFRAAGRRAAAAPFSAFAEADPTDASSTDWFERAGQLIGTAVPEPDPASVVSSRETRDAIAAGVAVLPAREREVIFLAYQEGLTQSEIAARLGWPIGTVKTRMRRAHRRLREQLDGSSLSSELAS